MFCTNIIIRLQSILGEKSREVDDIESREASGVAGTSHGYSTPPPRFPNRGGRFSSLTQHKLESMFRWLQKTAGAYMMDMRSIQRVGLNVPFRCR